MNNTLFAKLQNFRGALNAATLERTDVNVTQLVLAWVPVD